MSTMHILQILQYSDFVMTKRIVREDMLKYEGVE